MTAYTCDAVKTKRAYGLDALRGLAILLMVLSGRIPWGSFPRWMYHGYYVPPDMTYTVIPGITWVDLVFPFFIFAMGAAFPLALTKRLAGGMGKPQIVKGILKRGVLLLAFAIYNQHFMVWPMAGGNPEWYHYAVALLGFIFMFAIWGRFPWKISPKVYFAIKIAAILIVLVIFWNMSYRGESFSLYRNNIILHVLANMAVVGALIWLFTHSRLSVRLGLMAVFLAINLSYREEGSWMHIVGTTHTLPFIADFIKDRVSDNMLPYVRWLYDFSWIGRWNYYKYLFIIIPATICGEHLVTWINEKEYTEKVVEWSKARLLTIAGFMFGFNLLVITLLYMRFVFWSTLISLVAGYIVYRLTKDHKTSIEKLIFKLYCWGFLWYIIGVFVDPFEGGVKKDPSTLSYYFITAGLAYFLIIAFGILIDIFKVKKGTTLLVENGQNPMIAYVGYSNLILPIIGLVGIVEYINQLPPGWGLIYGIASTLVIAFIVKGFTKLKIFLRT